MSKYRVTFETQVQIDGWTDFRDREYRTERETKTVEACSKTDAIKQAIKQSWGYHGPSYWGYGSYSKWYPENVKKVTKIIRKKNNL